MLLRVRPRYCGSEDKPPNALNITLWSRHHHELPKSFEPQHTTFTRSDRERGARIENSIWFSGLYQLRNMSGLSMVMPNFTRSFENIPAVKSVKDYENVCCSSFILSLDHVLSTGCSWLRDPWSCWEVTTRQGLMLPSKNMITIIMRWKQSGWALSLPTPTWSTFLHHQRWRWERLGAID